jgi:hypothetical protein
MFAVLCVVLCVDCVTTWLPRGIVCGLCNNLAPSWYCVWIVQQPGSLVVLCVDCVTIWLDLCAWRGYYLIVCLLFGTCGYCVDCVATSFDLLDICKRNN